MKKKLATVKGASAGRRDFLKLPLTAAAAQAITTAPFAAKGATRMSEYDPDNTKIATMVNADANDDQFLFLQQIGVRWAHVQFPMNADFVMIKDTQDRLARHNIKIHCGIVNHYRVIDLRRPSVFIPAADGH